MRTPSRSACRAVLLALGLLVLGPVASACAHAPTGHPRALASSAGKLPGSGPTPSHIRQYLPHSSPPVVPATPTPAPSAAPPGQPVVPGQPVASGPGPCLASDLHVSIGRPADAAGSSYYPIDFANVGTVACTMYGYPGVSFVTGPDGAVIGGAAVRDPAFPKELVTLGPGVTAHASLQVVVAQNYPVPTCKPATAHWLAIYPPASYVPLYLAFTATTCTGDIPAGSTLGIYVVRPGATGP